MTAYVPSTRQATTIVPGLHVVGDHIVAGTYRTLAVEGCFWERVSTFDGSVRSRIDDELIVSGEAGEITVTIEATDVGFGTHPDCGTWTLV
ncbi:MAG: hypothetical protein ABJ382_04680 [Ilumatobacter sp.]